MSIVWFDPAAFNSHAIEGQAISARWRSLTRRCLSRPLPSPTLLAEQLANVLDGTGSFLSTQQSVELVEEAVLEEIELIIRLSLLLEFTFKVEITSSNMSLLFETPGTVFNGARMTNDSGFTSGPTPEGLDRIVGTVEVGLGKTVCGRPDESQRAQILLKTKVVLEKDFVADER